MPTEFLDLTQKPWHPKPTILRAFAWGMVAGAAIMAILFELGCLVGRLLFHLLR